jgi:hypothetical protein
LFRRFFHRFSSKTARRRLIIIPSILGSDIKKMSAYVHEAPFPGQRGTGGGGGNLFDSGCNLSGIQKIEVYAGNSYLGNRHGHKSVILRIVLYYNDGTDTSTLLYQHPNALSKTAVRQEFQVSSSNTSRGGRSCSGEQINKVLVWAAHEVWAVQFYTNHGRISPIMGGSPLVGGDMEPVEYATPQDLKKHHGLVGMFGAYGALMDRIGFSFGVTAITAFASTPFSSSPVLGTGGTEFDTGRNLSGVKQVVVWYACDAFTGKLYIFHMKLSFSDDTDTSDVVKGPKVAGERTQCFNVPPGTNVVKAFVWADQKRVRAVQFLTDRGDLSGVLGAIPSIPPGTAAPTTRTTTATIITAASGDDWDDKEIDVSSCTIAPATTVAAAADSNSIMRMQQPVEFSGLVPGESLVGMYGAVEGVDLTGLPIIRVGFTFAKLADQQALSLSLGRLPLSRRFCVWIC